MEKIVFKNVNKLDSKLKDLFGNENVKMENNENLSGNITFKVFNEKKEIKLVFNVNNFLNMENGLNWFYYSNPLNESSKDTVTRISTINTIATDVKDILDGNRFKKEYLDYLTQRVDESLDNKLVEQIYEVSDSKITFFREQLVNKLEKTFNFKVEEIKIDKLSENKDPFDFNSYEPDFNYVIEFYLENKLYINESVANCDLKVSDIIMENYLEKSWFNHGDKPSFKIMVSDNLNVEIV